MNKYAKPLIVGFIVLLVVSFLIGFLGGAVGADLGLLPMLAGLFAGGFTAYIMANLAGNRVGVAASDADRAQAASLIPPPGKGLLVVYREGFVAMAAGMNLALNGREFAQLKGGKFTAIAVEPGEHQLSAGFGGLAGAQNNAATVGFAVAPARLESIAPPCQWVRSRTLSRSQPHPATGLTSACGSPACR